MTGLHGEDPQRYALPMRLVTMLSLTVCCGFLGFGVSTWISRAPAAVEGTQRIHGFIEATRWEDALEDSKHRGSRLLVFSTMNSAGTEFLERQLAEDATLQAAIRVFTPVVIRLDGGPSDRALAESLGISWAPMFVILDGEGPEPQLVDALEPATGTAFERFGLTAKLHRAAAKRIPLAELRAADPSDDAASLRLAARLDAGGLWQEAAVIRDRLSAASTAPNSLIRRYERLVHAMETATTPGAAEGETSVDEALTVEDEPSILFRGWTMLGSRYEHSARRAAVSGDGTYLGVPRDRWERRLRETTRRGWIACPDELVLPYGALLIERYARVPADLDSLDRAFMAAVVRTMSQSDGVEAPHAQAWLAEARARLPRK